MSKPSNEQKQVIEDTSRIRVVSAAPGCGKTWLAGEIIKKELNAWNNPGGIAALSFTRVGGVEIRKAVGYDLPLPHFVGTLDSFLYKYVIKPFFNKIYTSWTEPRLTPAEAGCEQWEKGPQNEQILWTKKKFNLFKITYSGMKDGTPIMTYDDGYQHQILSGGEFKWIEQKKYSFIKHTGCMTHADVALFSYLILQNSQWGPVVRRILADRYPFIVVDELQDTSFFAGKFISTLLEDSNIRALLIGDANQAVYEFNGATPALFEDFTKIKDAKPFKIYSSRRCPENITRLANNIFPDSIKPSEEKESGKNILYVYDDFRKVPEILKKLSLKYQGREFRIIARSNKTVYYFADDQCITPKKLGCPALNHMINAVQAFKRGHNSKAVGLAESCISLWLFRYEGVDETTLKEKNIDEVSWKEFVLSCLLECVKIDEQTTHGDWQVKAGRCLGRLIKESNLAKPTKVLGPKRIDGYDDQMSLYFPQERNVYFKVQTVHSVKGETHDATIIVCPDEKIKNKCPSNLWWSTSENDAEERRIAYVAMTRSKKDLHLIVSRTTALSFQQKRPQFYKAFDEIKELTSEG